MTPSRWSVTPHLHHAGGGEHPPAFTVPLEPVADGLAQTGSPRRLLAMLAPVAGVLGIAVQRRQYLLLAVGEPHTCDGQVLAMLWRQAVRHPQPERQRAVIGHGGHAQLATLRLVPAAQHEELVTAACLPIPEPFLVTGVAVLRQVALLAPEPFGAEAQPDPSCLNVRFQSRQPGLEITKAPPFVVNVTPSAMLSSISDLPLSTRNSPIQAVSCSGVGQSLRRSCDWRHRPPRRSHRDGITPLSGVAGTGSEGSWVSETSPPGPALVGADQLCWEVGPTAQARAAGELNCRRAPAAPGRR